MPNLILTCSCGNKMAVDDDALGNSVICTRCGNPLRISRTSAAPANPQVTGAPPKPRPATLEPTAQPRLMALDQLRGYAIAGMIFVNYMGGFEWIPEAIEHNKKFFSYADTIAPLFVFVVGMGFRLSLMRRIQKEGLTEARIGTLKRYLILFAVGIAFYGPAYHIDWWDALIQIALSGILALLFIDKSIPVRTAAALGFVLVFNLLYFTWGQTGDFGSYAEWMTRRSMNGGFLSPITYAGILLAGTIAYDLMMTQDSGKIFLWSGVAIVGCFVAAFITHKLLPLDLSYYQEYGPYWTTTKRWSVAPFIFISTGLAFCAFAFFYWLNDVQGIQIPTLSILGMNPLILYLLQYSLLSINHTYLPEHVAPLWAWAGLAVFYTICYAVAWRLWKDKTIIKL